MHNSNKKKKNDFIDVRLMIENEKQREKDDENVSNKVSRSFYRWSLFPFCLTDCDCSKGLTIDRF